MKTDDTYRLYFYSVFDSEWFRQLLLDAVAIELKKLELEKE